MKFRTGLGFDVHSFAEDRKLILGGVEIPHSKGLLGHSDADVILHAVCDAMLGALALGDIGKHFPDTDEKFKGADSTLLLKHVYDLIVKKGYKLGNMDIVLTMQKPKIAPYVSQIREKIAALLNTEVDNISVKATTTERLGFVGREEGVSAFATVLLYEAR